MAYDPQQLQQQRPEQQTANNNRQGLNIQQPGELSDFDRQFFSPENWNKKPVEASVTLGDIVKAAVAAPLDMVSAGGELFRAGNQLLDDKADAQAREYQKQYGIDDQTMAVMRQTAGNPLSRAGSAIIQGVGSLAGAASQKIKDSYSDGAKKAASLDFVSAERNKEGNITGLRAGEGLFDKDTWLINAVPTIAQLISGGAMSKVGASAAREMAERAAFNRLSKSMPEEAARQLAKETADRAAAVAGKSTFVGTMAASAQGQGGIDMRNEINALSFDELTQSKTFQQAFSDVDSDPQYARLDDTQKLTLARNMVADRAATAVTADPRLLAVNIAASTLGDHTLLSLLTKKGAASGVASGVAAGALSEGATEFAQGAGQRYVQNQQLIGTAGQKIDPMKDVLEVGANNAVVGAGMGGAAGAVGGMRGHHANQSPDSTVDTPEWKASYQEGNQDNGSSIPVVKMGDDAPPPGYTGEWRDGGPVISVTEGAEQPALSPYEEARQRYATQDRAAMLREYASADLTNNSELKRAASERLDELDQHEKIAQKVEAFKQQSDDELLTTYRKLNENPKRSEEEQLQHEAVRTVLSERLGIDAKGKQQPAPQPLHQQSAPEVESLQSATPDNQSPNGIPPGRMDAFRDTPAYLRQDSRIQGFADDSDVQRALAEQQYAPTAEELISQQMGQGDQGYTPEELAIIEQAEKIRAARTPRLPAPGQTSVIAMPGELHPMMSDERAAGSGPQFDAGRQVRGQSFIPAERPQAGNEVGRASQTYDSETVPTHAIEDKGIIFSGSPTIDEGQTAQPPQFTSGETRTQRKTREFTEAMGGNNQAALPDQRHRVAGVPVDATTEAYARGEPVGELKFYTKNRPFTSEPLARHSKWGKMPGATVEEVEGGYAVRLPAPEYGQQGKAAGFGEEPRGTTQNSGKPAKIEVFRRQADGQVFLGYKDSTRVLPLKAGFKDSAEARAYLKDNRAELDEKLEKLRKTLNDNASKNGGVAVSGVDIGGGNIIHDGSFSRDGHKPETGMLRDRVQLASDLFVSHLNGAAKIKVKAVQTQAEAAAMMPNGIPAEFGTVHAIYQPELSRVIVIADNIAGPRELRAKLSHEIIAHHGLASVIGDVEYDRIMRVLHQTRESKNKTIQEVWHQVERSYGNESLEEQANEFLAHMAERSELTGLGGMWDRFISLLTTGLRKAGVISHADITPAEIRNILRTITGRFKKTAMYANEKPGTREFEDTFSRTDALYSKADDTDPLRPLPEEAEQYRTELGNAMRSMRSGDMSIRIGRTPPVLRALGAPNLDMYINRDTVRKATNGVKHDVPLSVIEHLPELMHDPITIYRSATQDNAVVALLEANDMNGNPVVSAVHMSAAQRRIEVNRIASVYGTEEGKKIKTMEREGLVLYRRKKENPDNPHSQGLQLPKEERSYQGSDQNILSSADIRKNKALYSRTGNPAMDAETSRKMGFNVDKGWFDKAKDFYQMAADSDRTELKQWWRETFRKLNTRTFDGLAPLKYAEDAAGDFDASVSGYTAARMAAGAGAVSGVVWEHGLVRYNKKEGVTERIPGTGKADSLMGIFDALGNQRENFLKWIAGHRSERLMAEGRENNFTADEIAYMKTLNRGNEALFADQKRKYDAFIKSILDLQQDMGLIDPESRVMWEDAWYLPYFREAENGEAHGPWTTRGVANQSSTVRKLKGSELTIKDPIENLFNYVAKSVDASMKNEAMRRSVVNLADTGVVEVIEKPNKIDYERIGKNVVKVYVDGQEQLVQVNDPDLYRAFTMIDMERSNSVFMKAARQAKRVLTIGTTAMPDFILRNFMRDSLHSWAINKDGFRAGISSLQGLRKALATDDTLVDMMAAGATFGGGYLNAYDPTGSAANIRKVLRRKGYSDSQMREFESTLVRSGKDVLDKLETAWEKYRHISEGAENANRVATYDAALKSGKSKAQAAFEARDLMDFSMMGSSKLIIGLTDVVPFLNARLQGMSKLGRAIKDDPREVLKRGGYIAGLSLALLALNWDDKRYKELPDWDKDAYWHFFLGDQHVRFPKPFEIGLMFGTTSERFVRMLGGEDSPGKFGKVIARNFLETMAFNPIPQVVKPMAEAYVNYDFFRGGPIESMADSNLIAAARYNDQTSLLMREIGAATGLSPKMLDHIVQGYTGTLGAYVLGATNIVARQFSDAGETPALRLDELPVIKSFLRGSDPAKSTQFADDFYRMMNQANQISRTINAYREQGRKDDASTLKTESAGLLSKRKMMTETQKAVRQLNDRIEMVRIDRTLSADEKRERINRMMAQRNTLYQQAVERVNPYFDR
ncbi:LPD38 domain-containing protein [Dickeya sp. CSL RW240]|uniref:LPD38 domain-containing protein n=1 Tax=Dickeya sp. CSL RW240 TaxID=1224144 RepID=UPI0008333B9B|nr:LPD38 domain-containing protein [Dickeya sp. CSL RW240]